MRFYVKMTRYSRTAAKAEVARSLLGLADVLTVLAGLLDAIACQVRFGTAGEGVWSPAGKPLTPAGSSEPLAKPGP